ncbi:hypothetical protein WJX72_000090 [[Myrmecia] bisecta]|uniref:EamA domain-containing protein n=1 Tax=[Myrmecia] bisecta TaxID=41462 RepID=A0AAW1PKF4_9CHLO
MPGAVAVPVVGVVASGVGYAVIRKVLFQMPGIGLHGIKHTFRKPLWASLTSAVGCTLCFVIYYWMVWRHRRSQAKPFKQDAGTPEGSPHAPLLQPEEEPPGAPMAPEGGSDMAPGSAPFGRTCFISPVTHRAVNERITARAGEPVVKQKVPFHDSMSKADYDKGLYGRFTRGYLLRLIAPAVTGSISIILQSWGLVYISASISLVVSSSLIVFTALLSIFFLKRDLNGLHWLGIWLAILGVACTTLEDPVSRRLEGRDSVRGLLHAAWGRLASQDPEEPSAQEYLLGILLTLASQLMAAVQMVLEESLLSGQKFRLHPLQLLGSEGTISTIFLTAIAMPIAYHVPGSDVGGCYENTLDTLAMLRQNRPHAILNTVMMLCSLVTNWTGCLVTTHLGSVFRCILMPVAPPPPPLL